MWAKELPRALRFRMLAAYRNELSEHLPLAWDDHRFDQALMAGSLGWLAGLLGFLPRVAEADVMWHASTIRQRIVAALEHFAHLAAELQRFPATGKESAAFASELRSRWPPKDCNLPPYPAFS
jgi:hypothetical protein